LLLCYSTRCGAACGELAISIGWVALTHNSKPRFPCERMDTGKQMVQCLRHLHIERTSNSVLEAHLSVKRPATAVQHRCVKSIFFCMRNIMSLFPTSHILLSTLQNAKRILIG
jgi:hypothetical protein